MSLNLHDHSLRLTDLELALQALVEALAGPGSDAHAGLAAAAQNLRSRGAKGAAGLLLGRAAEAAYRR